MFSRLHSSLLLSNKQYFSNKLITMKTKRKSLWSEFVCVHRERKKNIIIINIFLRLDLLALLDTLSSLYFLLFFANENDWKFMCAMLSTFMHLHIVLFKELTSINEKKHELYSYKESLFIYFHIYIYTQTIISLAF